MKFSDQESWFRFVRDCSFFKNDSERTGEKDQKENFTFINIIKEAEDTAKITRTRDLKLFFNYLYDTISKDPGLIDLVIVDAVFSPRISRELEPYYEKLAGTRKVLFAFKKFDCDGMYTFDHFHNDSCFGTISYLKADEKFLNFPPVNKEEFIKPQMMLSLPYLAYSRLLNVKVEKAELPFGWLDKCVLKETRRNTADSICYVRNEYIPELYPELENSLENENLFALNRDLDPNGSFDSPTNYFSLFEDRLKTNKKKGKRNILIVGSFKEQTSDIHLTGQGRMHGSVILASVLTGLLLERHQHTLAFFISLFCCVVCVYSISVSVSVRNNTRSFLFRRTQRVTAYLNQRFGRHWIRLRQFAGKFAVLRFLAFCIDLLFLGLISYWLWGLVFLVVFYTSHQLINVMSLFFVSFLLEKIFTSVTQERNPPPDR